VDVTADGQRFLFAMPVLEAIGDQFNVAISWEQALN
jgi:hypothetical protein